MTRAGGVFETENAPLVLDYVIHRTYAGLPAELWDPHLWLYGDLAASLAREWNGTEPPDTPHYAARSDGGLCGVAVVRRKGESVELCVAADDPPTALELARAARDGIPPLAAISTPDGPSAELIRCELRPGAAVSATCRLWTREMRVPEIPTDRERTVRELAEADAHHFDGIRFEDGRIGWPGYRACLAAGLRYFGVLARERLVSVAGLARLTRHRSEIIGVATFSPEDRRRGHARTACRAALAAALRDTPVTTWTTDGVNTASLATARSLGFKPYQTVWDLATLTAALPGDSGEMAPVDTTPWRGTIGG